MKANDITSTLVPYLTIKTRYRIIIFRLLRYEVFFENFDMGNRNSIYYIEPYYQGSKNIFYFCPSNYNYVRSL